MKAFHLYKSVVFCLHIAWESLYPGPIGLCGLNLEKYSVNMHITSAHLKLRNVTNSDMKMQIMVDWWPFMKIFEPYRDHTPVIFEYTIDNDDDPLNFDSKPLTLVWHSEDPLDENNKVRMKNIVVELDCSQAWSFFWISWFLTELNIFPDNLITLIMSYTDDTDRDRKSTVLLQGPNLIRDKEKTMYVPTCFDLWRQNRINWMKEKVQLYRVQDNPALQSMFKKIWDIKHVSKLVEQKHNIHKPWYVKVHLPGIIFLMDRCRIEKGCELCGIPWCSIFGKRSCVVFPDDDEQWILSFYYYQYIYIYRNRY
jgi:hypothetical protein